ncbi:hypothetical protein Zm00014a_033120 [Zea mays]|uniref:Uncharacterized protein n=1 Tax=Zea mays TaxID=4577 RepID=A0A3L6FKI6_MAIZE|nr:hypothetical protein Zm00014a_033120 [Zea mays]
MTISRVYCHFSKELTIIISKTQLRGSRCQFSEAGRCRVQNCKNLCRASRLSSQAPRKTFSVFPLRIRPAGARSYR